jgi:hypothetical protein
MVFSVLEPGSGVEAVKKFVARRTIFWVDGGCMVSPIGKKLVHVGRWNLRDEKVDK